MKSAFRDSEKMWIEEELALQENGKFANLRILVIGQIYVLSDVIELTLNGNYLR